MGNLCNNINKNIILYYANDSTFNKIQIQQLCDKNIKLLSHLNSDDILLLLRKIIEIVLKFNITDKLKFFNKYININNSSFNITSLLNCDFIEFTSNNIYVELYHTSIKSLLKLLDSRYAVFGLRSTDQLNNNYSIVNVNFNFIIDSIILSLHHLINRNRNNNIISCVYCGNNGYYNISGDLSISKSFCKLHKSIEMKLINYDQIVQDDEPESSTCIICMSALREIIFVPCGHIIICSKCSKNTKFVKCCLCDKKIDNIYKLYF